MSHPSRASSARSAMLWSAGFNFVRDVAQFGTMLVLVRILSPADYGAATLAQSILGLLSVVSFATFSSHALQVRNPLEINWQAHFVAAAVMNIVLFGLAAAFGCAMLFSEQYHSAGLCLVVLSFTFLVEIPGTLRHRMLEANHEWSKFRNQLVAGTLLALGCGLVLAFLGAGAVALAIQPVLLGMPAAADLLLKERFRPSWSFKIHDYRDVIDFGLNRAVSALAARGTYFLESAVIGGALNLTTLGLYSRARGLSTLVVGRAGVLAVSSIYPILTRQEPRSADFQRICGTVLQAVAWTTIPAAVLLVQLADDIVSLIYGSTWAAVAAFLPLIALGAALSSVGSTVLQILLANEQRRQVLQLDVIGCVTVSLSTLLILTHGIVHFVAAAAIIAFGMAVSGCFFAVKGKALTLMAIYYSIIPPLVCVAIAFFVSQIAIGGISEYKTRILVSALVIGCVYLVMLKILFPSSLARLLVYVPMTKQMRNILQG